MTTKLVDPADIRAVRINDASRCVCGHHPLRHDFKQTLLLGADAPCFDCDCKALRTDPATPAAFTLETK